MFIEVNTLDGRKLSIRKSEIVLFDDNLTKPGTSTGIIINGITVDLEVKESYDTIKAQLAGGINVH